VQLLVCMQPDHHQQHDIARHCPRERLPGGAAEVPCWRRRPRDSPLLAACSLAARPSRQPAPLLGKGRPGMVLVVVVRDASRSIAFL
jgi:hypothetical protein